MGKMHKINMDNVILVSVLILLAVAHYWWVPRALKRIIHL